MLLKKKKYTERILNKTDNELFNVENLIMEIEFKEIEQNVLKGIQIGNETLKQLNAVFSIEKIESILEETEVGIQIQILNMAFLFFFFYLRKSMILFLDLKKLMNNHWIENLIVFWKIN